VSLVVFIPIANDGWIMAETSPKYLPTFELNSESCKRAEKFRADIAAVTEKIKLYARVAHAHDRGRRSWLGWRSPAMTSGRAAEADPNAGVMLTFDDFLKSIERFGTQVIPLLDHKPAVLAMS
jgi:hypothetical protein